MTTLEQLKEISQFLGLEDLKKEVELLDRRSRQENATLVLPLVGEFSSGKTTLINALTDSKKLETATKPTTATIYEVHFGSETCRATVLNEQNELIEVEDIASLKNDALTEAKVVTVFDTSTKVPASTILVDTPGLSSSDPKHKQTLVDFLPKADGILLVTDINQQITRSLTDFIDTMKLSMRPIFLVLTKSDTKSQQDIEAAKQYISENCKIPLQQMAVVSAMSGYLHELEDLFAHIQKSKNEIIKKVDAQRTKLIVEKLLTNIEDLMNASSSDAEMDEAIRRAQYDLDKVHRNIERLVETLGDDIDDHSRMVSRKFEEVVSSKLNGLVTGSSNNFDADAISMINGTAALLMNEFKESISRIVRERANARRGSEEEVYLSATDQIDLSSIEMTGLSYNLDLNSMGHEYDGMIKTGVIAAAAVAAVAAVASTGGAAAGMASSAIDIADTVTDVGSIISNQKTVGRMERAVDYATRAADQYGRIDAGNQQMGQQMGQSKGIIDSMVGFVTEKTMSKPQRTRAIRNYIDNTLAPDFKTKLQGIAQGLVGDLRNHLQQAAEVTIAQKTASLQQLKAERKEQKALFEERINTLRGYKTTLLTL